MPPAEPLSAQATESSALLEAGARSLAGAAPPVASLQAAPAARRRRAPPRELGALLVSRGLLTRRALAGARADAARFGLPLAEFLARGDAVPAHDLCAARAYCAGLGLAGPPPDGVPGLDALARRLPASIALAHRAVPWARIGSRTVIATARPEGAAALRAALPPGLGPCVIAAAPARAVETRLHATHGPGLARIAECCVPEDDSSRRLIARRGAAALALALSALVLVALLHPMQALALATLLGCAVLPVNLGLRVAAWVALRRPAPAPASRPPRAECLLPEIALIVPLHDEPGIVPALVRRLSALDYPRALLDVSIAVEADDRRTRDALAAADLPPWMRVVPVPDGHPRTKPRAMNYALRFARGQIVGVYDAEDAPAPDQLRRVAARFRDAPADLACLQGRLDYYNPTRNWIARCFTIEYATWFRLVLPGIARLGLVMPLGGTTLFFRRDALEAVEAWDAHNVTEDADLGIRLARRGWRAEIIDTTTLEEANAHPLGWTRQRSRWLKGYALTWLVHGRRPLRLWRELGARRAIGVHVLLGGAVLNALFLPALWSTAVIPFGVRHPVLDWLPPDGAWWLGGCFAAMTLLNMALTWLACASPHHRPLRRWIPLMEGYYPLASLALAKAATELLLRPFHWDKTAHGRFGGTSSDDAAVVALHDGIATARAQEERVAARGP